jgi:hypothetical protein
MPSNPAVIRARRTLVLSLVLAAVAAGARAQTLPLQTEEATTAPRGTLVLETAVEAIADEPNFLTGLPRDRWAGPLLRLVHSPAENVEIDLEWTVRVGQVDDPVYGSGSDFGDVALRAKIRFAEDRDGHPAFAARFGIFLPETSYGTGLGPNALRMFAQGLVSKSWGGLTLHANAGLALHDEVERPHEQRDFFAYGIAAEHAFHPGLVAVAEWAGLAGKGAPGADAHSEVRAGVRLGRGGLRWSGALRRGLLETDGTWGVIVGATFGRR